MNDDHNPPNEEGPTLADVQAAAMNYLSRRDHAEGELRRKLARKDFPTDLIDQTLEAMRRWGYVDDARFARTQARILRDKAWGPVQITKKLRQRGIDPDLVELALAELAEEVPWQEVCMARFSARFGCQPSGLTDKERGRAFRHLSYRGFSSASIRRILFD